MTLIGSTYHPGDIVRHKATNENVVVLGRTLFGGYLCRVYGAGRYRRQRFRTCELERRRGQ